MYYWVNETNGEPFYVGKGRRERALRKAGVHRSKEFNDIALNNKCHVEIYKQNITDAEARNLECKLIAEFREKGCALVNKTNGGEGGYERPNFSEEQIKRFSETNRGSNNPNYGHKWTDEMKQSASKYMIETKCHSGGRNGRSRKVMCVETGIIYQCKRDATEFLGVKDGSSSIYFCLKNPSRVAGKGKYHFVDETKFELLDTKEKREKYLEELKQSKVSLSM